MIAQFDAVKEATDSFTKIFQKRNWLIGAPTMAGGFLIGVVFIIFFLIAGFPSFFRAVTNGNQTPDISPSQVALFVIGITVLAVGAIVVSAFTYAWTLVAADPVWLGRDPAFDRGFNRAAAKLIPLCAYYVLIALITLVSIITIVGPIIIAVLAMYGPCFIVFKDRSATEAIGDSFRLVSENLSPSVILALAFIAVYIVGIVATAIVGLIPFIGIIGQLAFTWIFSAYVALAIVRFYDLLSSGKPSEPPYPIVPPTSN